MVKMATLLVKFCRNVRNYRKTKDIKWLLKAYSNRCAANDLLQQFELTSDEWATIYHDVRPSYRDCDAPLKEKE